MGQTLACCGKNDGDTGEVKTGNFYRDMHLQSPKFAALSERQKLALIIKIQSIFRGYMARKRVHLIKQSLGYRTN